MSQRNRLLWLGCVGIALAGLVITNNHGEAGGSDAKKDVDAIAAAVKKGDEADVKKMVTKLLKANDEALFDTMKTMKPSTDKAKGFTVGKAGDGIENMVRELAKAPPKDLKANAADLEQMVYRIGAIAHVAQATKQKKNQAKWTELAGKMTEYSQDLAKAIKSGDAAMVQKTAAKLDANCNQCHEKFR